MLKKVRLSNMLDALEQEGETRDHQRHEVLERACRIESIRSNMFIAKQVKTDESSTSQRAENDKVRLKYCELWSRARMIHQRTCQFLQLPQRQHGC